MNIPVENESGIFQSQLTRYKPAAFAFASLALLFLLYQVVGGGITLLLVGGEITDDTVTTARIATMLAQFIFLLVPTIYLAKKQHGALLDVFRWRIPSFRESFFALAGMIALMQIAETYLFFQGLIPVPDQLIPVFDALKKAIEEAFKLLIIARSTPELLFVIIVAALTPSICEELMFRGLIQKSFSMAYGSTKGFIVAGTIFGLYHMNPFWLVPLIALGIYFSFLQFRSQTLLLPIAAHFINNASATVGMYVYGMDDTSTPTIFLAGGADPSIAAALGSGIVFSLIFVVIMMQYIKTTEHVLSEEQGEFSEN